MSGSIKRVLVIGGTGSIGKPVAHKLLEANFKVTVGTRSAAGARRIFGEGVRSVEIDNLDKSSVLKALQDQDAIHLNLPSGPRFEDCFRNETRATEIIAAAARESGIQRISYLSGTAVGRDVKFPPSQAKWQAEEAVRASGVPYTICRATWFMETLHKLVRGHFIAIIGSGKSRAHWLAGEDLGRMVARSFAMEEAANKVFYAFGPELLSYREAVKIFRRICHPGKMIVSMPTGIAIAMGNIINRELWFGAQMIKFLDQTDEIGDPDEANRILGSTTTTLTEFLRNRA